MLLVLSGTVLAATNVSREDLLGLTRNTTSTTKKTVKVDMQCAICGEEIFYLAKEDSTDLLSSAGWYITLSDNEAVELIKYNPGIYVCRSCDSKYYNEINGLLHQTFNSWLEDKKIQEKPEVKIKELEDRIEKLERKNFE